MLVALTKWAVASNGSPLSGVRSAFSDKINGSLAGEVYARILSTLHLLKAFSAERKVKGFGSGTKKQAEPCDKQSI